MYREKKKEQPIVSSRRSSPKKEEANLHIHIRKYITQTNSSIFDQKKKKKINTNTSPRAMKTSNRHQTQQKDNNHADQSILFNYCCNTSVFYANLHVILHVSLISVGDESMKIFRLFGSTIRRTQNSSRDASLLQFGRIISPNDLFVDRNIL